ncbi:response regulator [Paraburkholderia silviterrae]|uniref:Response regulator n=2 Tax=Paraburkholderia silviterrae TaxID=2528715 RepID=A0A4V2ZZ31_9BURK|nr:response regulator [Paraburkholderia silviterrae]
MALVCIVDDDVLVRKSLTSLLQSAGHIAASFASGEEFLASPWHVGAACILLDLKLKGMNGLEVQRRLIEQRVAAPIVFISSHADDEAVRRALERGARAFLHKPFSSDEMLEVVERLAVGSATEPGRDEPG